MKVEVDKKSLFDLLQSHMQMTQAEYERNPSVNSDHHAIKAEQNFMDANTAIVADFINYMNGDQNG